MLRSSLSVTRARVAIRLQPLFWYPYPQLGYSCRVPVFRGAKVAKSIRRKRYEVFGEFEIPQKSRKDGKKTLDFSKEALANFWGEVERARAGIQSGAGCYLFAVRASKGMRPWYVGQSKGAFQKECFAPHKQSIYRNVMDDTAKGTPVLFLIARVTPTGKLSKSMPKNEANFIERKLIHDATNANPELKNIQNATFVRTLEIPGVLNSPKGQPSDAVKRLKVALGT